MYKVGDKIICIANILDDTIINSLTIGKAYTIINIWGNHSKKNIKYLDINDDDNWIHSLPTHCFILLSEYRDNKIDKILDLDYE